MLAKLLPELWPVNVSSGALRQPKQFAPAMLAIIYDPAGQKVNYTSRLCLCCSFAVYYASMIGVQLTRPVRIASCDLADGHSLARQQFTSKQFADIDRPASAL